MDLKGFFQAGPQDDGSAVTGHYYEMASARPDRPQVWAYTERISYGPGEELVVHAISSAAEGRLEILRDGPVEERVWARELTLGWARTPEDCAVRGCGWPERLRLRIPQDWRSGVYVLRLTVPGHQSEHLFVLRAAAPDGILMILCTGTWAAYNDWGGSNHYQGLTGPHGCDFAPEVSLHRPWARGFVRWPEGAPRIPHASPLLSRPRYPHMEFARAAGISKKYASSGWAAFERPFALWAEAQGIGVSYATQHDLHGRPDLLAGHSRAVIVGHDEYWTWEMRDHLEEWLDGGGELARFAGNFFWQSRLSADLSVQTCYKHAAPAQDPVAERRRMTSSWDHPQIGRPAVATLGLTGTMGIYAGWSRCAAHGAGGFTIYRPEHWALRDSGLGYGDVLGAEARIFGYEVDGIDYGMVHGLPFASEGSGLAGDLTIIGLSPATSRAHATGRQDADAFIGDLDAEEVAAITLGAVTPETLARASRGNGCMAEYRRGRGAVFNAGSCEWVAGLIAGDAVVERITRRVLLGDWV